MARRKRTTQDYDGLPTAVRTEDSRWALPDGRFFRAGLGSDFGLLAECLDLTHLAKYPTSAMLDTFWQDPRGDRRAASRLDVVHMAHHEDAPGASSRSSVGLQPLPPGHWWLFEEPANGSWLEAFAQPLWAQIEGGETRRTVYERVRKLALTLEFAPAQTVDHVPPTFCARHGEPHSRREVSLGDPCPLCGRPAAQDDVARWLVPRRSTTPPRMDYRLAWERFEPPEWLTRGPS